MNRIQLQQMADARIVDAGVLLDGARWEFAYCAAGYAVECGLKSCVLARMSLTGWVFDLKWKADQCLTHDFGKLIDLAGLNVELDAKLAASAAAAAVSGGPLGGLFASHWGTATQWKVDSRYLARTELEARGLYEAITQNPDGVLPWIKT